MSLFSFYFSGSPIKFIIGLILLFILAVSFIRGKQPVWKKMGLNKKTRVLITVVLTLICIMSGFNIGHKQSELNREQFDNDLPDKVSLDVQQGERTKPDVEKQFQQQLDKSRKENQQ